MFGNVSRSAEVSTFDSATFSTFAGPLPLVAAQTATTFEIGTRGTLPDLTWDLAFYRSELRNEFQCLRTSPFSLCSVVKVPRTIHQGVEVGLGVATLKSVATEDDRIWLNAAYTYNDFAFDRDPRWGHNELPGIPPHYLRTELLYKHPSGFYAGPSVEWMPSSFFADNANRLTVPAYALLNVRLGYDVGVGWSGYVEGRNLLDKRYISTAAIAEVATASSELFNPGMGRAVYAGLR